MEYAGVSVASALASKADGFSYAEKVAIKTGLSGYTLAIEVIK